MAFSSSSSNPTAADNGPLRLSPGEREAAKRVVLLTVLLDILGFGIVIPQLGIYAAQFGASPSAVGWLASIYSAMQFLFAPFWGKLSDRIGRRPVLLWSVLGTAISYFMFAWSNSLWWLFASRIFAGVTGANIAVAQAYLSDVTAPEERFKTFGIFGAIFGIGFAIGPLIGSLMARLPGDWGGNFGIGIVTGVLGMINFFLALKMLPETLSHQTLADNAHRHKGEGSRFRIIETASFRRAFAQPGLSLLMWISLISIIAFATLQGTFTLYILRKYTRPDVQTRIAQQPQQAIAQAKARLQDSKAAQSTLTAPMIGEGGESAGTSHNDNQPYTAAMGGDFNPKRVGDVAPPPGLSWRQIEKALVQRHAAEQVGWIFTTIGILALVVQGGLINPLKKRFGEMNLVIAGVGMLAVGLALVPLPAMFWGQFPVAAVIAIGNSISAPILTALVSLLSPEAERGEVIGVFQSTQSLGRIIGPIIGNYLFDHVSISAPYYAGAIIMLFAFGLAFVLRAQFARTQAAKEQADHEHATKMQIEQAQAEAAPS